MLNPSWCDGRGEQPHHGLDACAGLQYIRISYRYLGRCECGVHLWGGAGGETTTSLLQMRHKFGGCELVKKNIHNNITNNTSRAAQHACKSHWEKANTPIMNPIVFNWHFSTMERS